VSSSSRLKWFIAASLGLAYLTPIVVRYLSRPALYLWLGGLVLVLGFGMLGVWYRSRRLELAAAELEADDWTRLHHWRRHDWWACPRCGAAVPGLAAAEVHMDPDTSACAAYQRHLDNLDTLARNRPESDDKGPDWAALVHPGGEGIDTLGAGSDE
jgi:hypothetical protein